VRAADHDVERLVTDLRKPLLDTCAEISLRLGHREDS
jgi:hypothetical protein